jgi:DNA-binding transcriptional ArsR family regulator
MARSKKHLYPQSDQSISDSAKALFHPARLRIIRYLDTNGSKCVADIAKGHQISRESLAGHLNTLYTRQLVTYAERFPFSFYSLDKEKTRKALMEIMRFCNEILLPDDDMNANAQP